MLKSAALVLLFLLQAAAPTANDALMEAARIGNVAQAGAALDAGANVDARGRYDITPLITAAMNGHIDTVRLLVSPPAGLPDGEYWARLAVLARGGQVPLTVTADTSVKVGLSFEVRTLLPVLYRKGKVATGVAISDLRAGRQRRLATTAARTVAVVEAGRAG